MKNELEKIGAWVASSSADPAAVSLTVKGILVGSVPALMVVLGFAHASIGVPQVDGAIDATVNLIQATLTLVAAVMTTIGIFRKLYFSFYPNAQ